MCGIVGIKAFDHNQDVGSDLIKMLNTIKHRGPDGSGVFIGGKTVHGPLENLKTPEGSFGLGHNLLSIVGTEVTQPIEKHGFILVANAEIYNFRQLKSCIKDNFKTNSDCEVIINVIQEFYNGSLIDAVKKSLNKLDGDYAFAIYDGKDCVVVRDPLGVKPLYYGENDLNEFAFASERKALWKIGIENVYTLAPDHVLFNGVPLKLDDRDNSNWKLNNIFSFNDFNGGKINSNIEYQNFIEIHNQDHNKIQIKNLLKELLVNSVEKRIKGLSRVGIVFSGGVDSTVIARISQDLGVDTTLYTAGHENSSDMKFAKKTAEDMCLPLKTKILDVEDIKYYTGLVLNAIEEYNIMKLGVGMPAYLASEMAHDDGVKVMMSGQGADEIFAGYHRYTQFYSDKGEKTQEDLEEDILNLYHVNLQRDDAVTMANSVELRVPYLDLELVKMVMKVPMNYKLDGKVDGLRKCILREIAADIGVPYEIVRRPKKAAQYGSGIHKILVKKVLKDENYKNILEVLKN
ncbi:asparagine synthase (glutamine-hydrolyzing) [Methanobacterium spitsbergense]|uniref:Putative asparagine synthetase [glutamine-hydrolyzing] n=1 Tax=Methanobacterium spitsbergense TaxID=2874285 RepID=A0A8T5UXF9_9EURY|nr:asparagine synthase (glutamine-hydrolyzing) [Methanobacterium spitsbergense]MBZ2165379.1 asparagine synthase (glutamine-hydrolyzing) [Methanobacterium spitsbergense]